MTNQELIKKAYSVCNPWKITEDVSAGGVGCALLTDKGNVYTGVCIDTSCSMGFCAEHSAIAQMITNRENRIIKIVAVLWNGKVVPPCGRCRELMYQIQGNCLETEVIISEDKSVQLSELLPLTYC